MSTPIASRKPGGVCAVCGHEVAVMPNGYPWKHRAHRVQRGPAGQPEIYKAEDCDGTLYPAEPLPPTATLAPAFVSAGAR